MKFLLHKLLVLLTVGLVLFGATPQAAAFTPGDFSCVTDGGTCHYDPTETTCTSGGAAVADSTAPGPVYIMGDSITALSASTYTAKFSGAGWDPTVEGLSSRHTVGTPPSPDGLNQIKKTADRAAIAKAHAIVIALGTNDQGGTDTSIKSDVVSLMDQLKSENSGSAPIYWVNILDTRSDANSKKVNQAIADGVGTDGTIIDWYTEANSKADLASFQGGVHPTKQTDIDLLVNLVFDTVVGGAAGASTATSTDTCACPAGSAGGTTALVGADNEEKTWNYFKDKGLSDEQVAGIMGNMLQESGFNPLIMQIGGQSKDPYNAGTGGWGIIQWSGNTEPTGDKFTRLFKASGLTGPIYELATQLDLVWEHMHNHPVVTQPFDLAHFKTLTNEVDAGVYFGSQIEGFGIAGNRFADATSILQKFGGNSAGSGAAVSNTSSGCAGSKTGSPICATATGNAKILCEAKKYDPVDYVMGGGHAGGTAYHKACPTIAPNDSGCALDCSGLVSVAVFDAFAGSGTLSWDTNSLRADTANWKEISFADLSPGDVIEPNPDHIEIVDHVVGSKIFTFGAHTARAPQPKQVGPSSFTNVSANKYYRYVGPGSS